MKESNYYLYIIPQTGEVIRCKDFNKEVETELCTKYGRIFSVSGYSKAVSIVSMVEEQYGEIYPTHGSMELCLDDSFICEDNEMELEGMNHASKETSWGAELRFWRRMNVIKEAQQAWLKEHGLI